MPAGYEDDPLLAVLAGEPLPPDADPATRAAHEAALEDVRLLRGALREIGDTLAAEPVPVPVPEPRPVAAAPVRVRRRAGRRAAVLWAAGLTAAAAVFTGVMYVGALGGAGSDASFSMDGAKSAPEGAPGRSDEKAAAPESTADRPRVACASLAVQGTVVSVRPLTEGSVRVVLEAERYWAPEQEAADAPTAVAVLPESAGAELRPGTRALVALTPGAAWWATGDRLTTELEELDAPHPEPDDRPCR
ncbi:hypothetical protein [Streptomyces sp. NPDC005012]|uniref:hypothetical protein n=1 Tax=Streptomyces sp. NPDC005012 TaxID=3154558 RepID=UPI0033BE8017